MIRLGFWGPLYENYNKGAPPQNNVGDDFEPCIRASGMLCSKRDLQASGFGVDQKT